MANAPSSPSLELHCELPPASALVVSYRLQRPFRSSAHCGQSQSPRVSCMCNPGRGKQPIAKNRFGRNLDRILIQIICIVAALAEAARGASHIE
jgi:hypothetical protein